MAVCSERFIDTVLAHPRSHGICEAAWRSGWRHAIAEGDLVVDGGAALGSHTFLMARAAGARGHVVAYEPLRHIALMLRLSLARRGHANVQVVPAALSNRAGFSAFTHVRNCFYLSGLERASRYPLDADLETVRVRTVTLDADLPRDRRWAVGKFDLEGGEFHAFQGASGRIGRDRPLLFFESGRDAAARLYGYRPEDWFSFFAGLDYVVIDAFGQEVVPESWTSRRHAVALTAAHRGSRGEAFARNDLPRLLERSAEAVLAA